MFVENLAYSKSTDQSSIYSGGDPSYERSKSRTAVNGILYGDDVTHTKNNQNEWWRVDLGSEKTVRVIEIYNRVPNCKCVAWCYGCHCK